VLLMLLVAVPLLVMAFTFAWKYRATNIPKQKHSPNWSGGKAKLIFVLPAAVVAVLAVLIWKQSHVLDPYKPLQAKAQPITIQVVALQWKWLFIYPEQGIATVNFVEFPKATPVNFVLTADAPMNSFWIPQLGGQIYAMSGMATQTHLMADEVGEYAGSAAEISGAGFANMKFTAKSTTNEDF
jgi:cytochrome o ubiquinol oxidase subunit 2